MSFCFPELTDIARPYMDGLGDKDIPNFTLTYMSKYVRHHELDVSADELLSYATSYFMCGYGMTQYMHRFDSLINNITVMTDFSVVIPVLYNYRHAVELAIKALCQQTNKKFMPNHNLLDNWKALNITDPDMNKFVEFMDNMDSDGMTLRYPFDKTLKTNQGVDNTWVNLDVLADTVNSFLREIKDCM